MRSSATPRGTHHKWQVVTRPWVLLTVSSLLAALLGGGVYRAAPAAAAPLDQTSVIINNLQGASSTAKDKSNTDSKWATDVRGYIQAADIVLLQEAGPSGPPSARELDSITTGTGDTVRHFRWGVGTGRATAQNPLALAQVYFLQTDDNGGTAVGGRTNLAIVTRDVPDEVAVVRNPSNSGRDALGVRFGNNWYFTLHGLAFGGNRQNDSAELLNAIAADVQIEGIDRGVNYTYTVGGDFNRDPADLRGDSQFPSGARPLATGLATQQAGGELDYFVTNDPASPVAGPTRMNGRSSDHYPVMLGGMAAAAGPQDLRILPARPYNSRVGLTKVATGFAALIGAVSLVVKRSVDFVGDDTTSDGFSYEGTPGEEISGMAADEATAIPKYRPNVVLLEAGGWDIQDGDASGASDRLASLVDQIQAADPTAVVMVATLPPSTNAADEALVTAFNTAVQQMVAAKVAGGQRVVLADMSGLTTADLESDGVTPNDSGQQKIADSFAGSLAWAEVMGWISEPTPASPPAGSVCDIYAYYGTPCTGAYSMTRAMYSDYDGPLYQVQRASDNTTQDIGVLSAGGDVDTSEQDNFCANTSCTVTEIYDQSPQLNNLTIGPAGTQAPADSGAAAAALPVTLGGKTKAYGLDIEPGTGYRNDYTRGIATKSEPEGMYMVASGTNVNSQCCFDFGNAEVSNSDTGAGHMAAVNLSTRCVFAAPCSPTGGPWVQADLENGLFQGGNGNNTANKGNSSNFVTAMLKDGASDYALKGGDAQAGGLSTWWEGPLPDPAVRPGYNPMSKEGAIVLGVGGDNSNKGTGSFFEGVMTDGTPTDAADAAVQANIVAAGYGGDSAGAAVPQNSDAAVVNGGITYDFSVDAKNGDLQEASLAKQGADWAAQDLSASAHTPPVMQGTTPVAVVHDGVTSVFTISADDGHLWETHMRPGVTSWTADDLTAIAKTPPSKVTPSALFHDGYTTVYTVDASNGHLQTTYLEALDGPWTTADLTAQTPGAPAVQPGTSPASIQHNGVASVFTVGTGHDIWETYLPTIDGKWSAHDITALSNGPETTSTVTAVFHQGVLTVFAAGDPLRHLFKLSLPALGSGWSAQDLTAGAPHTPPVAPGTAPAALFHNGYTSVYTVDEKTLDLRTTYLPSLAGDYATEDLSADYQIPPTTETPVPLLHPGDTGAMDRLSVFTVNQFDNDLQDSHLVKEGDPWATQDMNALPAHVPPVRVNASPTATWSVASDGITYVFSSDPKNGDLIVTYLTAQGADWQTKDLTAAGQAPRPERNEVPSSEAIYTFPTAVAWKGHVTVFSVGDAHGHLWATTLSGPGGTWTGTDLSGPSGPTTNVTPSAVFHGGQLNAYIVAGSSDATAPGDLVQYYLPNGSNTWQVLDLTKATGGPQVAGASAPSALFHDGYTSVYINAAGTHHLQNYFLSAIGNPWAVQDLTEMAGTKTLPAFSSPTALYHSGYVTVFSLGADHGDIWETSLPAIGDSWTSQDLTAGAPHTPPVNPTFSGGAIQSWLTAAYHSGYATVYSVNSGGEAWNTGGDLHATFLPAIGDTWQTQDLTTAASTPLTNAGKAPSALVHYDEHGGLTRTSVFTINYDTSNPPAGSPANYTLNNTYLVKIGGSWTSQSLPN